MKLYWKMGLNQTFEELKFIYARLQVRRCEAAFESDL